MFRTGGSYKVKIQLPDGKIGFGRATIVDMQGTKVYVSFSGRQEGKTTLPIDTKVWMVGDSAENAFNGLWTTVVSSETVINGVKTSECSSPKFTPIVQRRRFPRYAIHVPVFVSSEGTIGNLREVQSLDLSRSGVAVIGESEILDGLKIDDYIHVNIDSAFGYLSAVCRVVRNTNNWLTNQTELGLEFSKLDNEATDCLDRLMASLERTPTQQQSPTNLADAEAPSLGLSGWIKGARSDKSLLRSPAKDKDQDQKQNVNKNLRALQSKVDSEKNP